MGGFHSEARVQSASTPERPVITVSERRVAKVLRKDVERGEWCEMEVKLTFTADGVADRLSITGSEGTLHDEADLEDETREYWLSFFEENSNELGGMFVRFKEQMVALCKDHDTAEEAAAALVLEVDGRFHGLDLLADTPDEDGHFLQVMSCGCIHGSLVAWFPEVEPWIPWHLNDMKASCEHQEALGWGHGRDIALARGDCTEAQLEVLDLELESKVARARHAWIDDYLRGHRLSRIATEALVHKPNYDEGLVLRAVEGRDLKALDEAYLEPSLKLVHLSPGSRFGSREVKNLLGALLRHLRKLAARACPDTPFRSEIFTGSLGAPCPTCGYRYGTAWLKRELPAEVVSWFDGLEE